MNEHKCNHQWFQTFRMMEDNIHRCIKCGFWETKQRFEYLEQKPLTDEQINSLGDKVANEKLIGPVSDFRVRFARAIERAHGISNE